MNTRTQQTKIVNGVNVTQLFETIDTIKSMPVVARFRFRNENQWIDGGMNRSTIDNYHGACEDHQRPTPFVMTADEPPILLGQDRGANPVEYLLHALTACVTTSMVFHAAARGIQIQEIESTVEGDIDLHGFLGLNPDIRRGFQNIRMNFRIKAEGTDEQFEEIYKLGPTYSPVYDSVTNGVPVTVTATRM